MVAGLVALPIAPNTGLVLSTALLKVMLVVDNAALFDENANCLIAKLPYLVMFATRMTFTTAPEAVVPTQVKVAVIELAAAGVFATKKCVVLAFVPSKAEEPTKSHPKFWLSVICGMTTLPDTRTNAINKSPAAGVKEPEA